MYISTLLKCYFCFCGMDRKYFYSSIHFSLLYLIAIALRFVRLYSIRRCRPLTRLFFTGRAAPKHQPGALTVNPVGEKAGRDAAGCVPSADKTTRLCGYLYKVMPERRQQMKPTGWKNSQLPLITEG